MEVDGLLSKEAQTIEHKGTTSKEYPVRRYKSRGEQQLVLKGKDSDKEGVKVGRELDEFKGQGDTAKELIFILYQRTFPVPMFSQRTPHKVLDKEMDSVEGEVETVFFGPVGEGKVPDYVLIFGKTQEEHDQRSADTLKRIQSAGVTLNKDKCVFNTSTLTFLGHVLDKDGISADPGKTSAINQEESFKTAKLTKPTILFLYDPGAETKLSSDASSYGLGTVLLQAHHGVPVDNCTDFQKEVESHIAAVTETLLVTKQQLDKYHHAQATDTETGALINYCKFGWPVKPSSS
ncbi:hypothetical protein EMCRGX_G032526 [Ephydatia muelleri]